jgi:N-acetylglucosaminyldiphosphoundecaprenol N-acetyl-beta-D-mannosaminyltransferase
MVERLKIGLVDCDFMERAEFLDLCQAWLQTSSWHHVVTLNAEMVALAEKDAAFRTAVAAATLRVPEGGPLWARSYLQSKEQCMWRSLWLFMKRPANRLTGVDMVWDVAKLAADTGQAVYLLGGTVAQNTAAAQALRTAHPALKVTTSAAHDFTTDGPPAILANIQDKQPAILLVAYGAPKQTIWLEKHKEALPSVKIAVGVGGALAMIAGDLPRAPGWFRHRNIEWLWRLWLEPHRIGRIWRAVVVFPHIIKRQKAA